MPLPRLLSNDAALAFEGGWDVVSPRRSAHDVKTGRICFVDGAGVEFTTRRRRFPLCAARDCNEAVARLAAADETACVVQEFADLER
jgi:succinylarginine dihydrolase